MDLLSCSFRWTSAFRLVAFRLILWGTLTQWASAQTPLTLRVAQENVAAGDFAQIKVYADAPALIARGTLAFDLDPSVFGPIERVATFSANGDATALARVNGTHVEISIASPTGGIGQLPEVPVVVVRAPVLATATSSGFVSLSLPASPRLFGPANYPADAWTGPDNKSFTVTLVSGTVSTGAITTISGVSPGVGFLSKDTVLSITGTGFTPATKITWSGLAFSSWQVISSNEIRATLQSATEITGARFRLQPPNSSSTQEYFVSPPSALAPADPAKDVLPSGSHIVFPYAEQQTSSMVQTAVPPITNVLQNATQSPTDVRVREISFGTREPVSSRHFTIASGAAISLPTPTVLNGYYIDSAAPLRTLRYQTLLAIPYPAVRLDAVATGDSQVPGFTLIASPNDVLVKYQIGTPPPTTTTIRFYNNSGSFKGAAVQVAGAPWLSASQPDSSGLVTLTFDPSGLAAGTYKGTITGTPTVPPDLSEFPATTTTATVTLVVSAQPSLTFGFVQPEPAPNTTNYSPAAIHVNSNGTPAAFTATTSTRDGANWLSIDRTSGTTPATINIQANPTGLTGGYYLGSVFIQGPQEKIEIQVNLTVYPIPKPSMAITPTRTETREEGTGDPTQTLSLQITNKSGPATLQITTDDGGKWLTATVFDQSLNATVMSHIDSTGMPPGTYYGTIVATAGSETAQARITLNILPKPTAPPRAFPASFTFRTSVGIESEPQTLTVDSDPALVTVLVPSIVRVKVPADTTATYQLVGISGTPGTFTGSITVKNSVGTTTIPVTVEVTGTQGSPPILSAVVSGASHRQASLAPGEIITLHGVNLGPQPVGPKLDDQGRISTSPATDTRVEIDGRTVPVLYASPSQWNVVVPYEVKNPSAAVQLFAYGAASRVWTLPVVTAEPGIFVANGSGVGQGAVLNQDNSANSPTNPAPVGTVIQFFATGGGQFNPAATTGSVNAGSGGTQLPVKVFFADDTASVTYAGPAPGFTSGLMQVNAVVPPFGQPTSVKTLRLSVEINGVRSAPVDVSIR